MLFGLICVRQCYLVDASGMLERAVEEIVLLAVRKLCS